jgi:uncharacterized protein with GYD domain
MADTRDAAVVEGQAVAVVEEDQAARVEALLLRLRSEGETREELLLLVDALCRSDAAYHEC